MGKLNKLQLSFAPKVSTNRTNTPKGNGYSMNDLSNLCVYAHYYKDEDKPFYIGQGTIGRAFSLFHEHRSNSWNNKVKGNTSNVTVKILKECNTKEESLKVEADYIKLYGKLIDGGSLVNIDDGGEVIGREGDNNYFANKHFYGDKNGNYGNKYSKNPLSKPIIQIDILGNVVKEWASATEVEEKMNICASNIIACCMNKRHIARGYQWIYKNEYDANKDYSFVPSKNNTRITICVDLYDNYIKTYYSNAELINDGFNPKNVSQVCTGAKKSHKHYVFRNFFLLPKDIKEALINNNLIDITRYDEK